MTRPQDLLRAQRGPRAPAQKDKATPSQSVKKAPAQRRSERIMQLQRSLDKSKPQRSHACLSLQEDQSLPLPPTRPKRLREADDLTNHIPIVPSQKRLQPSSFGPSHKQTFNQRTVNNLSEFQQSHISHWAKQKTWPDEYFQEYKMHPLLARDKSTHTRSLTSLTPTRTPSDQRPREEKIAPYRDADYLDLLEKLGDSYMRESPLKITGASKALQKHLLERECTTPKDTLFGDDVFDEACENLQGKNEARVMSDFARLLVPSPESLAAFGAKDLKVLVESVNEGWNNSMFITSTRPQPDFAVGFRPSVFSDDQLSKIQPLLGDRSDLSIFRATRYMFFPFLTSEVKCGEAGLELADRQNAHSMTLAVRGIVELFKLGSQEKELHRELLTFSISHNHREVRIYGYYPVFDGSKTKIHRHQIHGFNITALDGKERWTTYKFTVAVYYHSLTLLKKILSILDDLPPDFADELVRESEPPLSEPSGPSQQLENQVLTATPNAQPSQLDLQTITSDTSTQTGPTSKKRKKNKKIKKNKKKAR